MEENIRPALRTLMKEDWATNKSTGLVTRIFLINYRLGRSTMFMKRRRGMLIIPAYAIFAFVSKIISSLFGCSIPFSARLGRRIRFQHGLHGVFISGLASIGDDCCILHHVTIGSNVGSRSKVTAAPSVGSRVFIGAGAKVIGNLEVGEGAMIGAHALISRCVPAGARCIAPQAEVRICK